jgi:hypothetical protein
MIRTGTIRVRQPGNMQVEGLHNPKTRVGQFFIDQLLYLFTGLIES